MFSNDILFLSALLTLFTSIANDGSVWDFQYFTEQVIKNNMSTIFPVCITLIAGYIISREQKDDTLENILAIPISFKKLLAGKLIVCTLVSVLFGIAYFAFTIVAEIFAGFPDFTLKLAVQALFQITLENLFLYIAVLLIIVFTSHSSSGFLIGVIAAFVYGYGGMLVAGNITLANIYPITASLGLIGYRGYDTAVHWNFMLCAVVALILLMAEVEPKKTLSKVKHTAAKKGW